MSQLNDDCLNEIFKHLENDKDALYSCLLVNRHWCKFFVRIMWRNVWNYDTLIACLPNESKEILYKNGIIPTPNLKLPMFNYVAFCTELSDIHVRCGIKRLLEYHISSQSLNHNICIIAQEIYKLFMKQTSLRTLESLELHISHINFTTYPGAKDCLKYLSDLRCRSDVYPGFFHNLSQICHNIQSLSIEFERKISNGLGDLISAQKNLKYLNIYTGDYFEKLIPLLSRLPNTIIKLDFYDGDYCRIPSYLYDGNYDRYYCNIPFSFITNFTNLQELILSVGRFNFDKFQSATFPRLQILKFGIECPSYRSLIKFLERNGKNLKELYLDYYNYNDDVKSLNLAIAEFCPNIRRISSFIHDLESLKYIFNNCEYLESLKAGCDRYGRSNMSKLFELVAKYSPKNFIDLRLHDYSCGSEELGMFFDSWESRVPKKSLSLTITNFFLSESMRRLIESYTKLGVIKCVSNYDRERDEEDGCGLITLIMKIIAR